MPRSELQKKLDRIKRSAETPLQRKERRAKRKQEKARREAEAEVPVPTRSADKSTSRTCLDIHSPNISH
jgi:vacuolar-type H+-ATPase subunit E/Vma4